MKIEEAQIIKRLAESQILALIKQLERNTNLEVLDVYLEKLNIMGQRPSTIHVELEVKL